MYKYCLAFQTLIFCLTISTVYLDCEDRKPSPTCLFTSNLPINSSSNCENDFCMPAIGNGFLGTFIMSDTINVAGTYNGHANVVPVKDTRSLHDVFSTLETSKRRRYDSDATSNKDHEPDKLRQKSTGYAVSPDFFYNHTHRARIASTIAINFTLTVEGKRTYALDVEQAIFYQWFDNTNIHIEQSIYAHRQHRNVLVNEIQIKTNINFSLYLQNHRGNDSRDITFVKDTTNKLCKKYGCILMVGQTNEAEYEHVSRVTIAVASTPIPSKLDIKASNKTQQFRFITAISISMEDTEPIATATKWWLDSMENINLMSQHIRSWKTLWKDGNVTVGDSNMYLSQVLYSSLYNILSSIRSDWIWGLSPGNLAGGEEYLGHVFWDEDIWMYPSILMLYPELANIMQSYRHQRISAAEKLSKKYGYKGVMFPWESAVSGFEVCPYEVYGKYEIHITGDIAFAAHQYYTATGDMEWLKTKGFELMRKTVEFWISRSTYKNGFYMINDVMPPDEYQYPVNNSFYTNSLAKLNVQQLLECAKLLKKPIDKKWIEFEQHLYLPYDQQLNYHPEFEGYTRGTVVKQADVILTNFPLMIAMENEAIRNDLEYYGNVTDPNGPAMTHSMFTIGWLQINENIKAQKSFEKNFEQINGPFHVWSEIRFGRGARNFNTAAGGFLQSIIYGYGGLRLKSDGLYFNMQLPPNSTQLQLNGMSYRCSKLDFQKIANICTVRLIKETGVNLLYLKVEKQIIEMELGKTLYYCHGQIYEESKRNSSSNFMKQFPWVQLILNFFITQLF